MINQNLKYIFTSNDIKVVFLIGAGCSKEYGLPLGKKFMKKFLEKFNIQKDKENLTEIFLKKYKSLTSKEKIEVIKELLIPSKKSLTYKILCNLVKENYCELIITTNYDNLIEKECLKIQKFTYNELKQNDYKLPATQTDKSKLIKIAGDIETNIPLWDDKDFEQNIEKFVSNQIKQLIGNKPIIFMGYSGSEEKLQTDIWKELDGINNFIIVSPNENKNLQSRNSTKYIKSHCENFMVEFADFIVKVTEDRDLYAFSNFKYKIIQNIEYYTFDKKKLIINQNIDSLIELFIQKNNERILVIEGESGIGKSFYFQYLTLKYNKDNKNLFLYINRQDVTNILSLEKEFEELMLFKTKNIIIIFDDFHLQNQEDLIKIIIFMRKYKKYFKFILLIRKNLLRYIAHNQEIDLSFIDKIETFSYFTINMIEEGLKKYNLNLQFYEKNVFKLPIFLKLAKNVKDATSILYILNSYENTLRLEDKKTLYKIYIKFYKLEDISINLPYDLSIENFQYLVSKGILFYKKDEFKELITIHNEILNEFLYAKIFLVSKLSNFKEIISYFKTILKIDNYKFKVFSINTLRYFLAFNKESIILKLLTSDDISLQYLAKEALSLKKKLSFNKDFLEDYFLMAIMLLDSNNFKKIYNTFKNRTINIDYLDNLSFYIAANRYKKNFKKFVEYSIEKSSDKEFHIGLVTFIIYVAYNGYDNELYLKLKQKILTLKETNYKIEAFIEENISKIYKFIFYGSNMSKSFLDKKEYFQDIKKAFIGSLFDLDFNTIKVLVDADSEGSDMLSWILIHMLIFREIKVNKKYKKTLELLDKLFQTGELRYQDFVLTILGHLSKYNKTFLFHLEKYTFEMRKNYPNNFYSPVIGDDNEGESQYDPWVPLLSSRIKHNFSKDEVFKEFFDIQDKKDINNILKILYKLAIDYPEMTIQGINQAKTIVTSSKDIKELNKILNVIRFTHPDIFWRNSDINFSYEKEINFQKDINKQSINQIHDWNWFEILNSINFEKNFNIFENIENKTTLEFITNLFIKQYY